MTTHPTLAEPTLHESIADAERVLSWQVPSGTAALASAAIGGGLTEPAWVTNVQVPLRYGRTDLDTHAGEIQDALGLRGHGITLLTATDIRRRRRGQSGAVTVDATSGITKPTYAASDDDGWSAWSPPEPGTINLVAYLPVTLEAGAAVNAVITMTEAKTQALADLNIPGTGTASDAVVVLWPADTQETARFAGPRSPAGAALARATYAAVRASAEASIAGLR